MGKGRGNGKKGTGKSQNSRAIGKDGVDLRRRLA